MADVRYILEHWSAAGLVRAVALPLVGTYQHMRTSATTLTWTLGDEPVREHTGIREQRMTLRGVSGLRSRRGQRIPPRQSLGTPETEDVFADGPTLFRELERFLEDYEREAQANQLSARPAVPGLPVGQFGTDVHMVFRAFFEQKFLKVEPVRFQWTRDKATSRHTYEWEIELLAYREVEDDRAPAVLGELASLGKAAADMVDVVGLYGTQASGYLRELRSSLDSFAEPVRSVGRVAQVFQAVAADARSVLLFPRDVAEALYHTSVAAVDALYDAWDTLPAVERASHRSTMIEAMGFIADVRRTVTNALGFGLVRIGPATSTPLLAFRDGAATQTITGTDAVVHQVQQGETLADIALLHLGARARWVEIAALNGMPKAWALPDGQPLPVGALILVPATATAVTVKIATDPFGVDLLLDADGDIALSGDAEFATVRGPRLLQQALTQRTRTVQGENAVFPLFGFPRLVGEPLFAETAGFVASQARQQYLRDPRIASVDAVEVLDGGDRLTVASALTTAVGQSVRITSDVPVAV